MMDFFQAGYAEGKMKGFLALEKNRRDDKQDLRDDQDLEIRKSDLGIRQEELGIKKDYLGIAQQELGIKLEDLSMRKEEFGWKRDDRAKSQELEQGVAQAGQAGGFTGVIDYLTPRDPERAVKLYADKLKTDESIMSNEVMSSMVPTKKQEALFASYGMLGKMSQGLADLPPEQQPTAYKQMLPMIKKVWPDAPDELNDEAKTAGALFIAQSTPENVRYKMQKNTFQAQSQVAKVAQDYNAAVQAGDTKTAEYLQGLMKATQDKATYASGAETRYKLQQANNQAVKTRQYQQDLNKGSATFMSQVDGFSKLDSLLDQLEEEPGNSNTAAMLSTTMARIAEPIGVLTDADVERLAGSAGLANWSKKSSAFVTGKNVPLNTTELAQIKSLSEYMKNSAYNKQKAYEQEFDNTIGVEFSDVYSNDAILKPTRIYEKAQANRSLMKQTKQLLKANGLDNLPPDMKIQAMEALSKYDDPKQKQMVIQKIKALSSQPQQAMPQEVQQ